MKYLITVIAVLFVWYIIAAGFASFVSMSNRFDLSIWDEFDRGLWLIFGIAASIGACSYVNLSTHPK